MPLFQNPTVLITRPKEASEQFARVLGRVAGPFQPLICPAFEVAAVDAVATNFEAAVFTSRAGVSFAPEGQGRVAYCVGDATANAATDAGYRAINAQGSAQDLCAVILGQAPRNRLVHIRGENSVGDVRATLQAAGIMCSEVVAYRKQVLPPDSVDLEKINDAENMIIPLFSSETVSILAEWPVEFSIAHFVAISSSVAAKAKVLKPTFISVSPHPDMASMVACTNRLIA